MLYPIIKVRDKQTGTEHIVGENIHDALSITENGQLQYINYQCLDGTGDDGAYQFVDGTEGNYREIEFVTLDQLIDMAAEHLEVTTKAKIMSYKSLRKIMDAELQKTKKETGVMFDTGRLFAEAFREGISRAFDPIRWRFGMTEAEAKRIIVDDPGGNIARRLEALEVAYYILGDDCTMEQIWKWAESS